MNRFVSNVLGALGIVFALVTLGLGGAAYSYGKQRDGQARGARVSAERGDAERAARYKRGAEAYGGLSAVLVQVSYSAAALALVAGVLPVLTGKSRNRWTAVATVVVLAGGLALGAASRPN